MTQLAPPLDVRDHRFGAGGALTVGAEEEYMLLDPATLDLAQRAEALLRAEADGEFARLVSPELFESIVEFRTPVCADIADLERQLRRVRGHAVSVAAEKDLVLGSAGTHPFSLFERQHVTRRDRYRALIEVLQYAARRELIFGFHVHVAVSEPDEAIRLMGALQPHLCELVALSASSPFWRGQPTGFASCRHMVFSAFPRAGPSPVFESYAEYADVVGRMQASGCIEDYTRIWWDVRPHPHFGTIEVRVMDALSRVDDAVALAAYVQALVAWLSTDKDAADRRRSVHPVLSQENKWQAARFGLDAVLVDGLAGGSMPVRQQVERTLGALTPTARDLGSDAQLAGVRRILRQGTGADRQRATYARAGRLEAVVAGIARESRTP